MKFYLTIILLILARSLLGQTVSCIDGKIIDSATLLPVASASIILANKASRKTAMAQSDESGHFLLEGLPGDSLTLHISCIGYDNKTISINPSVAKNIDTLHLGLVYLLPQNKQLGEVVVEAKKPVIRQEIDRLVYDAKADADSKIQSVLELMAKVPLLSLDGDENILLKGSGSYKIFINGRPSSMVAQNPKEALRAMPANTVQRIEVITMPPAKYDAEGFAGIINIVLDKRLNDGFSGSVGSNYNNTVGLGENFSITAKTGKLGIAARSYMYQDFYVSLKKENERENLIPAYSHLTQDGIYSFKGNYTSGNAELSFEFDSLNLAAVSVNVYRSHYDDRTTLTGQQFVSQNNLVSSYQSLNTNPQSESGIDLNFNYQRGFKRNKNSFLTFSYQLHYFPNQQTSETVFGTKVNYQQENFVQLSSNGTHENTFQVDYTYPLKKIITETGVKAILRRNYSDYTNSVFDSSSYAYIPDNNPDADFRYFQNVYGIYNSWQFKLNLVELKAGIRLEATSLRGEFHSNSSVFKNSYANLIPVISLMHRFPKLTIGLGFTQRILRPGIFQLNPFTDKSNPQFIRSGNPSLKPVLNNNLELSYSHYSKMSLTLSLSYAFANNDIQLVTTFADTASYSTYLNAGKSKTAALNANISYPFSDNLSLSVSSSLTYLWIEGTFNAAFYRNSGIKGYAYGNLGYKMKKGFRAAITATFVSGDVRLQGSTNAYIFNSYRLSKELLNKKLLISAFIANPYKKYREAIAKTTTSDFHQTVSTQRFYRSFGVSVNYNFGNLKSEIKKNKKSINNDDTIGKDK